LLGIYSSADGFARDAELLDNESPIFPRSVMELLTWDEANQPNPLFADFEICPLEAEVMGAMQAACITDARRSAHAHKSNSAMSKTR
jgi:hypothetical protein